MKYILPILFIILIITSCSTKNQDDNDQNISEEVELSEDLKADEMLKRDKERYDSMKQAQLNQKE
ncbi:MAG: PBP1b-binding outer membrane lipoprotein LpoB [Bacteroidia bacterium]|jgi:PBP1b-binding outer membrane lipoprotein LpoB